MDCERYDELIEAMADGDPVAAAVERHVAECVTCQRRLRLARDLDRVLEARETVEPPPGFTARVMERVGREQWRTEQLIDAGFNVALALGGSLVVVGTVGLAWVLGWLGLDQPTLQTIGAAVEPWLARAAVEARTIVPAALLLMTALGLWWWVEGEGRV